MEAVEGGGGAADVERVGGGEGEFWVDVHHEFVAALDGDDLVARPQSSAIGVGRSSSSCGRKQDILSEALSQGSEEACQGLIRFLLPFGSLFLLYSGCQEILF